jgi:hypothetical protein
MPQELVELSNLREPAHTAFRLDDAISQKQIRHDPTWSAVGPAEPHPRWWLVPIGIANALQLFSQADCALRLTRSHYMAGELPVGPGADCVLWGLRRRGCKVKADASGSCNAHVASASRGSALVVMRNTSVAHPRAG